MAAPAKPGADNQVGLLAANIVDAINGGDATALCATIDIDEMALLTAKKAFEKSSDREDFIKGLKRGFNNLCQRFVNSVKAGEGQAKFLRTRKYKLQDSIVIRLDMGNSGFDYLEYLTHKNKQGKYQVIDWYQLSTGQFISDTVGVITRLVIQPDPNLIKRFFGMTSVNNDVMDEIKQMGTLSRLGKYKEALAAYSRLPPKIKNNRILMTTGISFAIHSKQDDKYQEMLKELARHHSKDPAAAFMLIDHYFYEENWDKALESVGFIESKFGQDGVTELLRANIYYSKKDYANQERHAKRSIELEPDASDAYFTLLAGYLEIKEFQKVVSVFDQIMDRFEISFSRADFEDDEVYKDFVKSNAYKNWSYFKTNSG